MRTFTMVSLVMVGVGVGSMASIPTVVTVMIGMLPSLVAFIVDNRPGRYTFFVRGFEDRGMTGQFLVK